MEALSTGELVLIAVLFFGCIVVTFLLTKLTELMKLLRDMVSPEVAQVLYTAGQQGVKEAEGVVLGSKNKIDDAVWEFLKPRITGLLAELNSTEAAAQRAAGSPPAG